MTIDYLDKVLYYIKQKGPFIETFQQVPTFTEEENKYIVRAMYRLEKDGYVYSTKEVSKHTGNTIITFFISFDGILALKDTPSFLKNRPYKWASIKEGMATSWNIVKILAVIFNAVVILVFTYLTYIKDKADVKEQTGTKTTQYSTK